jgi:hypothetical protein
MILSFEIYETIGIIPYNFADDETYLSYIADCSDEALECEGLARDSTKVEEEVQFL